MDSDEDEEDTKTKFDGKPYVLQYLYALCIIYNSSFGRLYTKSQTPKTVFDEEEKKSI